MSFPIKYVGELNVNKPEGFNFDQYSTRVYQLLHHQKEPFLGQAYFSFPLPLIGLNLRLKLTLLEEHATIHAKYTISLFELNILFVLLSGLTVFFSIAGISSLMILFGIIAIGYYWYGLSTVSNGLKSIILQEMTDNHFMEEPGLWLKQQEWLKDEKLCSACGEVINPYSNSCINCGLHIKKTSKLPVSNISPTEINTDISYSYKKPE